MKKRLKEEWLKALRSGEYKQGRGMLCSIDERGTDRFCCLGVLADICGPYIRKSLYWRQTECQTRWVLVDSKDKPLDTYSHSDKPACNFKEGSYVLGPLLEEKLGLSKWDACDLATMNDKGKSFKQIAKYIEKNIQ